MKVLFVLPNMGVGGIERVRLALIEQFVSNGVACRLALRQRQGELIDSASSLAPIDELAPNGMHEFVPALVRLVRRERPTHVISAFADVAVLTWMALRLANSRACWIHTVDHTHSMVGSRPGRWGRARFRIERRLAGLMYRRANAIVAVSSGLHDEILHRYRVDPSRVMTIYNPVVPDEKLVWSRPARLVARDPCRIIALGRLVQAKGFDVLIRAMGEVRGSWCLDIWGEGPERMALEAAIGASCMQGKIRLRGYASDPHAVLRDADIFVLSSRHEGLGNALIEALAAQCQIVASDCLHGPREILKGGKLGQLVPPSDADAMADAINRAMAGDEYVDPTLLLDRARHFSYSESCGRWEALLRST